MSPDTAARGAGLLTSYVAVSLFSGCGGLDLGAEMTGAVRTVWAVDNDPWAVRT